MLQTFPHDWDWLPGVVRRCDAWHMVANAVPPLLAEHLGRALLAAFRGPASQVRSRDENGVRWQTQTDEHEDSTETGQALRFPSSKLQAGS